MASLNNKSVVPTKFELDSKFGFSCHKGISCFTRCCRNLELLLTPYDIIRLKKRLGMSSTEFLATYTRYREDEKTTHPLVFIAMSDDEEHLCPFVKDGEGCTIYSDRPAACRYYPVGQATHRRMDDENKQPIHDEWYVIVKEDHCVGFEENREWTIQEWREDQEAALCDEMNREWKNIMMKQDLPKEDEGKQKRQQMFYMASYDLDSFRRFVLDSRFLEVMDVPPATLENIRDDEVQMMHFAIKYLKYVLGIDKELDVKPHIASEQQKMLEEMKAREDAQRAALIAEAEAKGEATGSEGD